MTVTEAGQETLPGMDLADGMQELCEMLGFADEGVGAGLQGREPRLA